MMKHKIIGLILILALLTPVIQTRAVENTEEPFTELPSVEELSEPARQVNRLDEDIVEPVVSEKPVSKIPHKQPISKKKLVKLFFKAMIAVGISCIALYVGLTAYNRIRGVVIETAVKTPDGETPLSAPNGLEDAVKIFLEKTKW